MNTHFFFLLLLGYPFHSFSEKITSFFLSLFSSHLIISIENKKVMVIKLWYLAFISLTWLNGNQALVTPTIEFDSVGGQLGFIGDYAGLSPFKDPLQFESLQTNAIVYSDIGQENTQIFDLFTNINGSIETYCQLSDTRFILGGNFISTINSTLYSHIVQLDTKTRQLTPLQQGLDGPVASVYCMNQSAVYVGGHFTAPINSNVSEYTGHVALWNENQWSPLPWKGFNGPVYSIISHSESILFGGQFDSTGDGVYFNQNSSQPINLATSAVRTIIYIYISLIKSDAKLNPLYRLYLVATEPSLEIIQIPLVSFVLNRLGYCKMVCLDTGKLNLPVQFSLQSLEYQILIWMERTLILLGKNPRAYYTTRCI
jgi:hypothetical protein